MDNIIYLRPAVDHYVLKIVFYLKYIFVRSTPLRDEEYGGTEDLTAALAYEDEETGETVLIFRFTFYCIFIAE